MLNAGWLTASAAVWRRGDDPERAIRFPVPVWIIEHEQERILVDTGLHPEAARDPRAHYDGSSLFDRFALALDADITERVDVSTITRVVLTHLHFDHAGGLALLPPAVPAFVQRREWEAAHNSRAIQRNGYLSRDYDAGDREVVLVDGDHDLLGDGSVELLLTPGHTPGHQSVLIGGELVLGGDVAYFAGGFDDHRFPAYGDDLIEQGRSADRLRALRDAGASLLPGHDPAVLRPGLIDLRDP